MSCLRPLVLALSVMMASTAVAEDTGTSSNLFVLDRIADDTFFIFRANLATREGAREPFFGYVDANLRYALTDSWSLEAGYRHAALDLPSGIRQEYRPMFGLRWKGRLGAGHVTNRHRLELRYFEGDARDRVRYRNETTWTSASGFGDLQLTPFVEEEFFYDITDSNFNVNWLTFGVSHKWAKGRKWKVGYRLQSQKFGNTWSDRHVLVLGVSLLSFD